MSCEVLCNQVLSYGPTHLNFPSATMVSVHLQHLKYPSMTLYWPVLLRDAPTFHMPQSCFPFCFPSNDPFLERLPQSVLSFPNCHIVHYFPSCQRSAILEHKLHVQLPCCEWLYPQSLEQSLVLTHGSTSCLTSSRGIK